MQAPKTGQLLKGGKYEIRQLLGKGRFGEVYLAIWHHDTGPQRVAIKWFSTDVLSSQDLGSNSRLHQETNLLSILHHEAIVKILAIESEGEIAFLVEEFLAGSNLQEYIDSKNNLIDDSEEMSVHPLKFIKIALTLAKGLNAVHSRGFFHGDIKPSNICFRDLLHNEPVLVDFGHGGNSDTALLGRNGINIAATLSYLPPERTGFVKEIGNAASDLYSLGVSLYELITRKILFDGVLPKEIISKILCKIPIPISELLPHYPDQISEIIQKLMRKNPSERYQTTAGLIADLAVCDEFLSNAQTIIPFALGRRDKIRELNYKIPMVGRHAELEHLSVLMKETLGGQGKAVFVGAPSGSGKSRLAGEFSSRCRAHGMRILSAKFSEYEKNVPFSAIGVALQEYAIWMRSLSHAIQNEWRESLFLALGDKGDLLSRRLNYFSDLFPNFPPLPKMQKEEETAAFYEALAKFMGHLVADATGIVLFLDDLQWADAESLKVVQKLHERVTKGEFGRTLFIGTYRSDEVGPDDNLQLNILSQLEKNEKIALGPLVRGESDELVYSLIDESGEEIDKLKELTYILTQGNPFYIYEYLKAAISVGVFALNSEGTKWIFHSSLAASVALSRGAAGLVAERIQKLPQAIIETLLVASALGNTTEFSTLIYVLKRHMLRKLHTNGENSLKEQLTLWLNSGEFLADEFLKYSSDKLQRDHLISDSNFNFVFFHDKIRESAYNILNANDKKLIHHDFGEYLSPIYLKKENTTQKISSKDIFELAFHIIQGFVGKSSAAVRELLFLASKRAVEVFSYSQAKEYLEIASQMFATDITLQEENQWIEIHELLADCLALSEQLHAALDLYGLVLAKTIAPVHRVELHRKISLYNFFLFQYTKSIEAGIEGLKLIKIKFIYSLPLAIVYILFFPPILLLKYALVHCLKLNQKTLDTNEEAIRFQLFCNVIMSCFYTNPICAIANTMRLSFQLANYKENSIKAEAYFFWGVVAASTGFEKTGRRFMSLGVDYYERFPNPVQMGYMMFVWGYILEFPFGNLKEAQRKIKISVQILSEIGESFWRSNALQALIHIDSFGLDSGDSAECASQLIALWRRVKFIPTILGCVMKYNLLEGKNSEVDEWLKVSIEAGDTIKKQGYITIDSCYASLAPGEIHFMREEYELALPVLKEAFYAHVFHFHRVAYCTLSPYQLAINYIRLRKPIFAIFPLFICWLNQLLKVKIFTPYTFFATGEFFAALSLTSLGEFCFEVGINYAQKNGWRPILAEGQLSLGKLCQNTNPEYSESLIERASHFYHEKNQPLLLKKCEQLFKFTPKKLSQFSIATQTSLTTKDFSMHGTSLRQNIETASLLEIFLRLSSLTNKDLLIEAVLDSLSSCTGADIAIIFLQNNCDWVPQSSIGVPIDALTQGLYGKSGVDKEFLDSIIQSNQPKPCIRSASRHNFSGAVAGSVLVIPISHNAVILGYCYLGNSKIDDLFDEQSIHIIAPISTQAAIAIENVHLIAVTAEKAILDAELQAAKAVQEALLPNLGTEIPGMAIAHWYQAASSAGGDWLSYFYNPILNRVFIFIGDVTGHGFPSALITGVACGAVFSSDFTLGKLNSHSYLSAAEHLKLIAQASNQAVMRTGNRTERLMTMCFISIDVLTGEGEYISAGHVPPILIQKNLTKTKLTLQSSRLGYRADSEFKTKSFQLNPGDSLCIFTDGLTGNTGPNDAVLNIKQIRGILENNFEVDEALNEIVLAGMKIWQDTPFEDDVSLLIARWNGPFQVKSENF